MFRELVEIANISINPIDYLLRFSNIFDFLQIVLVSMIISRIADDGALASTNEQTILIVATFTVWVKLLRVIGNFFYLIAVFNTALTQVGNHCYLIASIFRFEEILQSKHVV